MKARVQWLDGRAFVGESGSGDAVVMDGAPEAGGRNIGVRPMEMLLMGLGGCTAFDIVMILERMREKVTALDIEGDCGRLDLRTQPFLGKVVAVERDVDHPDILRQVEEFLQSLGNPGAAAENTDQRRSVMQIRTNQVGQLAALGLGVRQGIGQR